MESPPVVLNLNGDTELTTEELFAQMCTTSRIPLDEVAGHPHGKIFDVDEVVAERDADCTARLDVGNAYMIGDLGDVLAEDFGRGARIPPYPVPADPARHGSFMNSSGTNLAALNRGKAYNPAYMHPDAIAALGLESGDWSPSRHRTTASRAWSRPTTRCAATSSPCITPSVDCRPRTAKCATAEAMSAGWSPPTRLRPDHRHAAAGEHPGERHHRATIADRRCPVVASLKVPRNCRPPVDGW